MSSNASQSHLFSIPHIEIIRPTKEKHAEPQHVGSQSPRSEGVFRNASPGCGSFCLAREQVSPGTTFPCADYMLIADRNPSRKIRRSWDARPCVTGHAQQACLLLCIASGRAYTRRVWTRHPPNQYGPLVGVPDPDSTRTRPRHLVPRCRQPNLKSSNLAISSSNTSRGHSQAPIAEATLAFRLAGGTMLLAPGATLVFRECDGPASSSVASLA